MILTYSYKNQNELIFFHIEIVSLYDEMTLFKFDKRLKCVTYEKVLLRERDF